MKFYKPDFAVEIDSPFARDKNNKLLRKNYWYDLQDSSIILIFNNGIGVNLTNEEKRNHLKMYQEVILVKLMKITS